MVHTLRSSELRTSIFGLTVRGRKRIRAVFLLCTTTKVSRHLNNRNLAFCHLFTRAELTPVEGLIVAAVDRQDAEIPFR